MSTSNSNLTPHVIELLLLKGHNDWEKLDALYKKQPAKVALHKDEIHANLGKIPRLTMLVYVIGFLRKQGIHTQDSEIASLMGRRVGEYEQISSWMKSSQNISEGYRTLQLLVYVYPQLFILGRVKMLVADLSFLLKLFNRLEVSTEREFIGVKNFLQNVSEIKNDEPERIAERELVIIDLIVKTAVRNEGRGNLGLLFQNSFVNSPKKIVKSPNQRNSVKVYCERSGPFLVDLNLRQLKKMFREFINTNINENVVSLINYTCQQLADFQEFYKLSELLHSFVLPELSAKAKVSSSPNVKSNIIQLTEFLIYKFQDNVRVRDRGLECILYDLYAFDEEGEDVEIRERWLYLAKDVALRENITLEYSSRIDQTYLQVDEQRLEENMKKYKAKFVPWSITAENFKKRKEYKYRNSNFKGIINPLNDCYIIANIQALFLTRQLPKLIERTSVNEKNKTIEQLRGIFHQMQPNDIQNEPVSIKELKSKGPLKFSKVKGQEDAHDYLMTLLSTLEEEFAVQNMKGVFDEIFSFKAQITSQCVSCHKVTAVTNKEFVFTIGHKSEINFTTTETVPDRTCGACKSNGASVTTRILEKGRVFIVHINRFSVDKGEVKKELSTTPIRRQIEGYQLQGMLFHSGSTINKGHYTYYNKIGVRQWALFDDTITRQFELGEEREEFEGEFRRQKTPYILFYSSVL